MIYFCESLFQFNLTFFLSFFFPYKSNSSLYKKAKKVASDKEFANQYFDDPLKPTKEISTGESKGKYLRIANSVPLPYSESRSSLMPGSSGTSMTTRPSNASEVTSQVNENEKKKRYICFLFEEDDGEYDESDIVDIEGTLGWAGLLALVLMVFLMVTILILFYFFYNVMSKAKLS
jgi:hypothetical protein